MDKYYHGTDINSAREICNNGIIITKGKRHTDFGQGFYITDGYDRAEKRAFTRAELMNSKPAIVTVYFDEEEASSLIERFSDDLRWGRFVINNRNGARYIRKIPFQENNLDARYQITYGRIADLDVVDVARELLQTGKMLMSLDDILNRDYPMQYAFHTEESLKYLKSLSYQPLT